MCMLLQRNGLKRPRGGDDMTVAVMMILPSVRRKSVPINSYEMRPGTPQHTPPGACGPPEQEVRLVSVEPKSMAANTDA